jgi:hypothetical protein
LALITTLCADESGVAEFVTVPCMTESAIWEVTELPIAALQVERTEAACEDNCWAFNMGITKRQRTERSASWERRI